MLDTKLRIIGPLARSLPGGYKFTPAKDLADEIEWAKVRRQTPATYAPEREPPVPADVFTRPLAPIRAGQARANRIDFEDMLTFAVQLYETDADALALTHRRYSWFSVDEYQDTNRLQEDLLRLWLGDRRDLCVVGDPDQTIYCFTGASDYLATFADRYPGARVVRLWPELPQQPAGHLAGQPPHPRPRAALEHDRWTEPGARPLRRWRRRDGRGRRAHPRAWRGCRSTEIAILVRTNAQLVGLEAALTAAEIPFTVRGVRFFARPDVRAASRALCAAMPRVACRAIVATDGGPSSASTRPRRPAPVPRRVTATRRWGRCSRLPDARGRAAGRHRRRLPRRARPSRR